MSVDMHVDGRFKARSRPAVFTQLWKRQSGRCAGCSQEMTWDITDPPEPTLATYDHRQPKSLQGANSRANMQLFCTVCNNLKGSIEDGSFRNHMWGRAGQAAHRKLTKKMQRVRHEALLEALVGK